VRYSECIFLGIKLRACFDFKSAVHRGTLLCTIVGKLVCSYYILNICVCVCVCVRVCKIHTYLYKPCTHDIIMATTAAGDASEISDSNIIGVGIPISFDQNRLRSNVMVRHVRFSFHSEYFIYYYLIFVFR